MLATLLIQNDLATVHARICEGKAQGQVSSLEGNESQLIFYLVGW